MSLKKIRRAFEDVTSRISDTGWQVVLLAVLTVLMLGVVAVSQPVGEPDTAGYFQHKSDPAHVLIEGKRFSTAGVPGLASGGLGVRITGAVETITIRDCEFDTLAQAITIHRTDDTKARIKRVTLERVRIKNIYNAEQGSPHDQRAQGIYGEGIDELVLIDSYIDGSGWRDAVHPRNIFSHAIYAVHQVGRLRLIRTLIRDSSSHGINGGTVECQDTILAGNAINYGVNVPIGEWSGNWSIAPSEDTLADWDDRPDVPRGWHEYPNSPLGDRITRLEDDPIDWDAVDDAPWGEWHRVAASYLPGGVVEPPVIEPPLVVVPPIGPPTVVQPTPDRLRGDNVLRPVSASTTSDAALLDTTLRMIGVKGSRVNDLHFEGSATSQQAAVYLDNAEDVSLRDISMDDVERGFNLYPSRDRPMRNITIDGVVARKRWDRGFNRKEFAIVHGNNTYAGHYAENLYFRNVHVLNWDGTPLSLWQISVKNVRIIDWVVNATEGVRINVDPNRFIHDLTIEGGYWAVKEIVWTYRRRPGYSSDQVQDIDVPIGWRHVLRLKDGTQDELFYGTFDTAEAMHDRAVELSAAGWPKDQAVEVAR